MSLSLLREAADAAHRSAIKHCARRHVVLRAVELCFWSLAGRIATCVHTRHDGESYGRSDYRAKTKKPSHSLRSCPQTPADAVPASHNATLRSQEADRGLER